jgi:hypothetical protein
MEVCHLGPSRRQVEVVKVVAYEVVNVHGSYGLVTSLNSVSVVVAQRDQSGTVCFWLQWRPIPGRFQ